MRRENIAKITKSNASFRKAEKHMKTRAEERAEVAARLKLGPRERAGQVLLERLGYAVRHPSRHGNIELALETALALMATVRKAIPEATADEPTGT